MPRLAILNAEEIKAFDKPPKFTPAQREKYFYLSEKLLALKSNLTSETNQLATVLQWGYFRATGRFFLINDFNAADIKYVADILNVDIQEVDLKNYQENRKTARAHQKKILSSMGFKSFDKEEKQWVLAQIKNFTEKQMQPREMIYFIASQCHQKQIEIPGYHYFAENITSQYNEHEKQLLAIVSATITEEQEFILNELISTKTTPPILSEWKYINQKLQVKPIQLDVARFEKIKQCFHTLLPLLEKLKLPDSTSEYYATWVHKAKVSQLRQMPNKNKLYLYLSAFVQHQFYTRQDFLIGIFIKIVQAFINKAKKRRLKNEQLERKSRNAIIEKLMDEQERLEALLSNIKGIAYDSATTDKNKIESIKTLLEKNQFLSDEIDQQKRQNSRKKLRQMLNDDEYYQTLESLSVTLQRYISKIVKVIDFDESTSSKFIMEAVKHFKEFGGDLCGNIPMQFLEKKHQALCYDESDEDKPNISLYKILLFIYMQDALKSGKLNVKYSYSYRAIQDYLIDEGRWRREKHHLLSLAGLEHFSDVETVLSTLKKQLDEQYASTNKTILANENEHASFNNEDRLHISTPKVEKQDTKAIFDILNEEGIVPIIQILHDINNSADFTDCFRHYSVKNQKLKPDAKTLIAGIMAIGHNIGIGKISQISKGINSNTLAHTVNWFFTLKNLQSANAKILAIIKKLSLSKSFKNNPELTHTASDGQKYQVLIDSLLANYSFKYFGKDKGVSAYTFIDDRDALFYGSVLSSSDREAAYVIDGLLHNDVVKSDIHSTDMHGYTESIFAATHFIGTRFIKLLKSLVVLLNLIIFYPMSMNCH